MLYEVDGDTAVERRLLDMPSLWRYRSRVTLEHLKREVEEQRDSKTKKSPYPVLDLFLREVVFTALLILILELLLMMALFDHFTLTRGIFVCS